MKTSLVMQHKRGTTAQNKDYIGEPGELTIDYELKQLRMHDGVTRGGFVITTDFIRYGAGRGLTLEGTTFNVIQPFTESHLRSKQDLLVSAKNIKTINYVSLLGSGNVSIPHFNDQGVYPLLRAMATTKGDVGLGKVDNTNDAEKPISDSVRTALNKKQDRLISGESIKTVNGLNLLGDGNVSIVTQPNPDHFKTINGQSLIGDGNIVIDLDPDQIPKYVKGQGIVIDQTVIRLDMDFLNHYIYTNTTFYKGVEGVTINEDQVTLDPTFLKQFIANEAINYEQGDGVLINENRIALDIDYLISFILSNNEVKYVGGDFITIDHNVVTLEKEQLIHTLKDSELIPYIVNLIDSPHLSPFIEGFGIVIDNGTLRLNLEDVNSTIHQQLKAALSQGLDYNDTLKTIQLNESYIQSLIEDTGLSTQYISTDSGLLIDHTEKTLALNYPYLETFIIQKAPSPYEYRSGEGLHLMDTTFSLDTTYLLNTIQSVIDGMETDYYAGSGITINTGKVISIDYTELSTFIDQEVQSVTYTAGTGLELSDTVFSINETYLLSLINSHTEEPITYGAGEGLTLVGQLFSLDTPYLIGVIENHTINYTPGLGLTLEDKTFNIDESYLIGLINTHTEDPIEYQGDKGIEVVGSIIRPLETSNGYGTKTVSTDTPSGGAPGDLWYTY